MAKKLRVGVIGLGNMGQYHVKHWLDIAAAELVGVVDIDPDRRSRFAVDGVVGYSSVQELIASGTVDAVSITSPTSRHHEHASIALNAGIHVLVEKPIAPTVDEGEDLKQMAEHHNCILQVGHIERFNPAILKLKEWMGDGRLGRPISFSSERVSPMPHQIRDADVLVDLAVHDLDIAMMIFGESVSYISSVKTSAALVDRADSAMIVLQYPMGIGTVSVGWNSPIKRRHAEVYFQNGLVRIDYIRQSIERIDSESGTIVDHYQPLEYIPPLIAELTSFTDAVLTRSNPDVSASDGITAIDLVQRAKRN